MRSWACLIAITAAMCALTGCGKATTPTQTASSTGASCGGQGCGQIVVRWASSRSTFVEGAVTSLSLRRGETVVSRQKLSIGNTETLTVPRGRSSLVVTVRVCDGNCGHLDPPITCRAPINADVAHPASTLIATSASTCRINVAAGYGTPLRLIPNRGIDRIRLGQTSTATARIYGPGRLQIHPARRTYTIHHEFVLAQFDHAEQATVVSSDDPALTLEGQPLARGYAYWKAHLQAQHWHVFSCSGTGIATSPAGKTSIEWSSAAISAEVSNYGIHGCAAS